MTRRVIVCGTEFGQLYLRALRAPRPPLRLAGVLARGSDRSRACAAEYGVPLYTDVDELPDDIDIGCVVVRGGLVGGQGSELAKRLMRRGIHVLQEHPLHHDELADCLREALRHRVAYRLNSFYPHVEPVRRFLAMVGEMRRTRQVRYVDCACGFQAGYSMLDIVARLVGVVRPWELGNPVTPPGEVDGSFSTLAGTLAGVPVTFRIHNELDPSDPDGHARLLHRVTLGVDGGELTLTTTHGPVLWSPRPGFPQQVQDTTAEANFYGTGDGASDDLDLSSGRPVGPAEAPSYREIFECVWPAGVEHALEELCDDIRGVGNSSAAGQYHLMLCRLWQDIATRLGPPRAVRARPAPVPSAADLRELARAADCAVAESPS